MGLLNSILGRFGYVKAQSQAPHIADVARAAQPCVDKRDMWANQAEAYKASSWLYKGVSTLARSAALVPLSVYQIVGDGDREPVENHPLEVLLRRPNAYLSRMELLESTYSSLILNGNTFWYVRPNLAATPGELWYLRPDRVTVVPDPSRYVSHYLYEVEGKNTRFEPEEIVHFRFMDPLDDYVGMGSVQPLAYSLETDTAAQEWNAMFFKNQARADGAFVSDQAVDQTTLDYLMKRWSAAHQGQDKAHKLGWLTGGFKWQDMSRVQKDIEFVTGRKLSREEIWQILNVPLGMWSENATEANAKVALQVFYNFGLWPLLCTVADKITASLLPRYGEDLVAEFEDVRITDRQLELAEESQYMRTHTVNETRAQYHDDEEIEGGNVILDGAGHPIPEIGEAEKPEPPPQFMPQQQPVSAEPEEEEPEATEEENPAEVAELGKWQKWALARMKSGRWPPERPFEAKHVGAVRKAHIELGLSQAGDSEQIKAAFAQALTVYP